MRILFLLVIVFYFTSCTSSNPSYTLVPEDNESQGAEGVERIAVTDATLTECPAGGKVYTLYIDMNANRLVDVDETPVSTQIVCNGINGTNGTNGADGANGSNGTNGTNGSNGFTTVFGMSRIAIDTNTCSSASGLQINSGIDLNLDGSLNPGEILNTALLCDGQNGATGAAGAAGINGHSMQFSVFAAAPEICAAGGSTLMMALDIHDNGFYSLTDPGQQQMTICNGANGANGTNGTNGTNGVDAPVPAYSPVDVIIPCGNTVSYKEVLLRLSNGQVLASFSENISGLNTRLSLIPDGTYMNTDGSNCTFSISTSGNERSISWFNQIQKTWSITP